MKIIRWINQAYHWLMPSYCGLCQLPSFQSYLCKACYQDLPWIQNPCITCATELNRPLYSQPSIDENKDIQCGTCLQTPPPYDTCVALFNYQSPVSQLILAMKFHRKLAYARLLAEILAEKGNKHYNNRPKPDLIIPMPLHSNRLKKRGYNQALELAKPLAKKLNVPFSNELCSRIVDTQTQSSMIASNRQHNVKQAFAVHTSLKDKYILIIDDVITTGSTVSALSQQLKLAHAKTIDVWCCAKTAFKKINFRTNKPYGS